MRIFQFAAILRQIQKQDAPEAESSPRNYRPQSSWIERNQIRQK
jgi:hypothetical protein